MVSGLIEAGVINGGVTLGQLAEVQEAALSGGPEDPNLHILCCNEYGLVTEGNPQQPADASDAVAESVRSDLAQPGSGARRFAGGHRR
ncbi:MULTISPECIES: hypothetical protein [Streptomyces]|uniref:Uncharacterized protein n=2 Tax=Streptomyces rimosus subsp. rimosus TaxID=132474 RepID=L8F0T2_STRR1|nr:MULTISPECIES: hypothetical protein [Streptomyces]KOG73253.1 hypothetical protein ADK78_16975 [Kitasatospora aureofaciens]MYT42175.1 hypothetical protein [Streptomyces sp. SID5471]KOT39515.1 hypothetical protein ADK84_14535 [Streptomyces sp. NRRL WC-3701]KOT57857.1 hypothetical protein ADK45_24290 [Streptomyces rimosus subsp. rimosus]KOT62263.1 hypothetical protein ADK44_12940 [Streptomyces rimosus subsp. rimosus]